MSVMFQQMKCCRCIGFLDRLAGNGSGLGTLLTCNISTSQTLHKKRQDRKYRPKVREFYRHGATHRLVRGLDMTNARYGPLVDGPDYTYLDGRPTPLTPVQMEERKRRKDVTASVVQQLKEMAAVKDYTHVKAQQIDERNRDILNRKLKPKS